MLDSFLGASKSGRVLPPILRSNCAAFETLDATGQAVLRRDLERLWSEHNWATDGTTLVKSESLEVVAIRTKRPATTC
jgi:hypothetical protein